jgi:mono/diheme cytochrome c family protein
MSFMDRKRISRDDDPRSSPPSTFIGPHRRKEIAMRMLSLLVAAAALAGCSQSDEGKSEKAANKVPAGVTFDGARVGEAYARIPHGERLVEVLGCTGCHGKHLEGHVWDNDPNEYGILWASNLTRAIPTMSDAQLKALLTTGVHPRRSELWLMPSELFQHLSPPDLDALIAYLRTVKPAGEVSPDPKPGPRAIREIESGKQKTAAALVRERSRIGPADLGASHALGRYIARVTCAECHGPKLEGHQSEEGKTPDLIVVGSYSRDEFEKLITEGIPTGNRKINELMVAVARGRFSHLTRHERDALYNYLKARAERPD